MALWIPSPNYTPGRPAGGIAWVVWHSTESPERPSAARGIAAGWFARRESQVSAHVVVDDGSDPSYPDGVVEVVKPIDTAWHCGPMGNGRGYGVEVIGRAGQGEAAWRDDYSRAAVRNACRWIARHPALSNVPRRWLSDAELRRGERGHITHAQVSRVLGGSTHTDPGPGFPFGDVLAYLEGNGDADVQLTDRIRDEYRQDGTTLTVGDTMAFGTAHAARAWDEARALRDEVAALDAKLERLIAALAR